MSPETSVNQITENKLSITGLDCIWWLHALEEYLERDNKVTSSVMERTDQLFSEYNIDGGWFMISDGSVSEDVPHYGHLASVGDPGRDLETDYPGTTTLTLPYSQYFTSEGQGSAEKGSITVVLRLAGHTQEVGKSLARDLLNTYTKQIGLAYPEFTVQYDETGPKFDET